MKTAVYPLPMDANLAREVNRASKATGLSRAELMRQAIAFGLPTVIKALGKPQGRITTINPLSSRQSRELYGQDDDDRQEVARLMAAQHLGVSD